MEQRAIKIHAKANPNAIIRVIPGHFATPNSHINYYVDMTIMKSRQSEAAATASLLATKYSASTYIDTIICMDGCDVIGAYLADELTKFGIMSLNLHKTMYVVAPEVNPGGNLIFRDNNQMMVKGKHCILLLANATTGTTISRALQCIQYYGGIVEGISAIFSASDTVDGKEINYIFGEKEFSDYKAYEPGRCPMCERGEKIDAIVNGFGYSKL